jgi:hypothetical protein
VERGWRTVWKHETTRILDVLETIVLVVGGERDGLPSAEKTMKGKGESRQFVIEHSGKKRFHDPQFSPEMVVVSHELMTRI